MSMLATVPKDCERPHVVKDDGVMDENYVGRKDCDGDVDFRGVDFSAVLAFRPKTS